ncbi:hypothetical protein RHSIM_Rhsim10G0166000 [Rhododendron simsii]|uniref:Uncharacterized protein n=1 Tax=Rhododendron simsii TaxID=118357 RepID=A0A834GAE3_RHOSS|nr:hypothetical protein RHSIM_Rhsim10G0166000 [Rhododendron simsii]
MYIQPGYFFKKLTGYERVNQKRIEINLVELPAAGIKNVPKSFFGLNLSGNGKVNDKEKNDIGRAVDGVEDFDLFDGEERLSSNSDNDDPLGSKANKVKETLAIPSRVSQNLKRKRGPTKLKTIVVDGSSWIEVKFDENGQPIDIRFYSRKRKKNVASISRAVIWANGHRDKNGQPKNANIAQKIADMRKIERNERNSTNPKEDAVSKVLGAERRGHLRTFGKESHSQD